MKNKIIKTLYLIPIIIALFTIIPLVNANEQEVGIYILNLGKFDVSTGTFTADFYLSIKCKDNCSGDFEFVNGRATSVDKVIDTPNEKFYRIQASLNSKVDLRKFPFEKQEIYILLEDKKRTIDELTYVPNKEESGIDDSITFPGWNIDKWEVNAKEHTYKIYNETYSQYEFKISISKIAFNSFLKTFLPIMFIIIVLMFTFIMDPDKIGTRITVASSSLVGAIMFHISITNQIPPVSYLTLADKFMIVSYFILVIALILNISILELQEQKKTELVEKLHRRTEFGVFIAIPLIYLLFFIFFVWL